MEEWISKNIPWIVASLIGFAIWFVKMVIKANKSGERLKQVEVNKKAIETLQTEMTNIKGDISVIKEGVDRQGEDNVAILGCLQSILNALCDKDCNVVPARDEFNKYLTKR